MDHKQVKYLWFPLSAILFLSTKLLLKLESLFSRAVNTYARNMLRLFNDESNLATDFLSLLGKFFMPERLSHEMMKMMEQRSITCKSSFASHVFLRNGYHNNIGLPEWKINSKSDGLHFARSLDVVSPKMLQENVPFDEITPLAGTVVKPSDECSGTGVFLVKSENCILELNSFKEYSNWDSVRDRVCLFISQGKVKADSWLVEELIYGHDGSVPWDVKFNMFYGQIGWIAVIKRNPPKYLYHIMDGSCKTIDSGLYRKSELFVSDCVIEEHMEIAKRVSLQIPAPFIRIDFLMGDKGLIFCEFTPRPGVVGCFNKSRDQLYGQMFVEAQCRLNHDLMQGKKFTYFA